MKKSKENRSSLNRSGSSENMEVDPSKEKRHIQETHSYACQMKDYEECSSTPNTPEKQPPKKVRGEEKQNPDKTTAIEPTLSELQSTIIAAVTKTINERADKTDKAVHYNTVQIDSLKKSLDFCHQEVMDLKKINESLKKQCKELEKKVGEMETKVNDADRYSRRVNLRLSGVPEKISEDVKSRVQEIFKEMLSTKDSAVVVSAIDIAHRVGKPKGSGANHPPRPIIIRFLSRSARDLLWKSSKKNVYLLDHHLRLQEDLTSADKEARSRLWPAVEAARKKGEKAYFVGNRAFVNGKEILLS